MIIRWILILLLFTAPLGAADLTPYKLSFGGNGYVGARNVTVTWLAERFDAALAWSDWGPQFFDSLMDTAAALGKTFRAGPYASSQEINLYEAVDNTIPYATRLLDTATHWLYIYAKAYMDSIGVDPESLVVHIADDTVNITQDGDGLRGYLLTGLTWPQKRFTYQYWNNTSGDGTFYPTGYVWLANGYNADTRQAIAYAYRRHMIEDSATIGDGSRMFTSYFMDNQYRDGAAPRLYSYYTINYTSGGATSGLDWTEQPGIEVNDSATVYFDNSTMKIDSTVAAVLDSVCDANSLSRIKGFANINKFSVTHLSAVLPYVRGVSLEQPIDYAKGPYNWLAWYQMADTMAAHPEVNIGWSLGGDILCSSDPASWRYDSSRIYLMHYSFFLTVRDTNASVSMMRFNDSTRWRPVYQCNFGAPDSAAYEVTRDGSSYYGADAYRIVFRRDYADAIVLVRTAHGLADYVNDSTLVSLSGYYYPVSAYADTAADSVNQIYLKPYQGWIGVPAAPSERGPLTTISGQQSPCLDSTYTYTFTTSDDYGLTLADIYIWLPDSVAGGGVNDSVVILDTTLTGTSWNTTRDYTWPDTGSAWVVFHVADDSSNVTKDSIAITADTCTVVTPAGGPIIELKGVIDVQKETTLKGGG